MFPVSRMLLKSVQDANLIFDVKWVLKGALVFMIMLAMGTLVLELPVYFTCSLPIHLYTPCALLRGGCHRSLNLHSHLKSLHNDD